MRGWPAAGWRDMAGLTVRDSSTKVDTCARLRLGLLGSGACATAGAPAPAGAACGACALLSSAFGRAAAARAHTAAQPGVWVSPTAWQPKLLQKAVTLFE